jgi:epoxyqueuosine reductase
MIIEKITSTTSQKGYAARVVPIELIYEINKDFQKLNDNQLLDPDIRDNVANVYMCDFANIPFSVKSVIVTASPCYITKVYFNWEGKRIPLIMPPTYMDYMDKPNEIKKDLQEILADNNYHIEIAWLPGKMIAAKSRLSQYGKNNITYIPGMGSFALLTTYYSDLPCNESNWDDITMMERCKTCNACIKNCPTGAISHDRFLVKAERCLTYHNEFSDAKEFPTWINPSAHNSIVGCMHCQTCCPVNSKYLDNIVELDEFNADETEWIAQGIPISELPSETIEKLERIKAINFYDKLTRNIKALLKNFLKF